MAAIDSLLKIILPKRRGNPNGTAYTNTFNPSNVGNPLPAPGYRDHLDDIFIDRTSLDSRALLKKLFYTDPDVSAAMHAYLTVANTDPLMVVKAPDESIDREGHKLLNQVLVALTTRFDYSKGFQQKPSLRAIFEAQRYMILLRGGVGAELVFDKTLVPLEIRHVDLATIEWLELSPNQYVPQQRPPGASQVIDLNIPTFFTGWLRRDPTGIHSYSLFNSSINTIAARQQVVNDLYRIMKLTGYPRLGAKVVEEILIKRAPANLKTDQKALSDWVNERIAEIRASISDIRADQAIVHTDAVEFSILNEKKPGITVDISKVIELLNAQNQAALKTMATIIGRGTSGVNTASVEARIFSMSADELNEPIADIWSQILTMAIRVLGSQSRVEVKFQKAELRPDMELEPQRVMKAARLKEDLSLGIISDDEYHLEMYGRIRPDSAPELSGTGFMQPQAAGVDVGKVSPNSDPLGRSITTPGSKSAKSKQVKSAK